MSTMTRAPDKAHANLAEEYRKIEEEVRQEEAEYYAPRTLEIIQESKLEILEHIQALKSGTRMIGEPHMLHVLIWDDRAADMIKLLTNLLRGTK